MWSTHGISIYMVLYIYIHMIIYIHIYVHSIGIYCYLLSVVIGISLLQYLKHDSIIPQEIFSKRGGFLVSIVMGVAFIAGWFLGKSHRSIAGWWLGVPWLWTPLGLAQSIKSRMTGGKTIETGARLFRRGHLSFQLAIDEAQEGRNTWGQYGKEMGNIENMMGKYGRCRCS